MNSNDKPVEEPRRPRIADLHQPVLRDHVVRLLSPLSGKTVLDGTLGLGGHAEALLRADSTLRVIGVDQDEEAIALARQRLAAFGARFLAFHGDFRNLDKVSGALGLDRVDGVLLDVGVSSIQLDAADRGFSFRRDGPLDMRMDRSSPLLAADWIATVGEDELASVLWRFGEERFSRRIARAIASARQTCPIATTAQLADIVRKAVPGSYDHRRIDPATRTFQAIRIFLNDELGALAEGLARGFELLRIGGTFIVITFHSLEDRMVKQFFQGKARDCECPPGLPECLCNKRVEAQILTPRPVTADAVEIEANPRSRSAKLRAATRLN